MRKLLILQEQGKLKSWNGIVLGDAQLLYGWHRIGTSNEALSDLGVQDKDELSVAPAQYGGKHTHLSLTQAGRMNVPPFSGKVMLILEAH